MNEIMIPAAIFFALMAAFLLFVKNDNPAAFKIFLIIIKGMLMWSILSGAFAASPGVFGAFFTLMAAVVFGFYLLPEGKNTGRRRHFAAAAGLFAAVLIFSSGCSGQGGMKYPAISDYMDLGFVPSAILSGEKNTVYVATERSKIIYLYNTMEKKRITSIGAGYMPADIKVSGGKLYSANKMSDTITIHDLETGKGVNIATGGIYPSAIALNQARGELYAANLGSNSVSIIDIASNTPAVKAVIKTGKWPSDLYVAPDNRYVYVCCKYTNTVQIIDAEKQLPVFTKVDTGTSPSQLLPINNTDIAIINEWEYAYNHSSSVIVFNRVSYALEYDIIVDGGIYQAALSKSRRYMYISVPLKDKIIFVDIKKKQKVYEIQFKDDLPKYLSLSADGSLLYAATQQSKKLFMIKLNDLR